MCSGVGISGIQVGVPWRVIAVGVTDDGHRLNEDEIEVFVNPVITPAGPEVMLEEGCLSFPKVLEHVRRPSEVHLEAMTPAGDPVKLDLKGWAARVVLHEVDHLDGTLFIDRMGRVGRRMALKQVEKMGRTIKRYSPPKKKPKKKKKKRRKR